MNFLLAVSSLSTLPQLLRVTDGSDNFACTGYGGQELWCGNVTRKLSSFFDIHQGSCKDGCAAADGLCHAGVTEMKLIAGDCGYGISTDINWTIATQPPGSNCKGKIDFLFDLRHEGCISNVSVRSPTDNVTIHFVDYASSAQPADVLINVSCPGVESARLRDVVPCTAYSGHRSTSATTFTFFKTSSSSNRVLFHPTGTGSVSSDTWSPPGITQYKLDFDYTLPAESVTGLGFGYQIQYLSLGKWENHTAVNEVLSDSVTPLPPTLSPTTGSKVACANLSIDTWGCTVEVRDDVGPVVPPTARLWDAFTTTYSLEGCKMTEVEVYGYEAHGTSAYTFNFTKLDLCVYKDLEVNLSVLVGTEVVSSGVQHIDAPGLVTPAPPTPQPTPVPTAPPTPTPTFPHKEKKNYDMMYIGFGCAALVLLVIGFGFFLRLRYQQQMSEKTGTWVRLGPMGEHPAKEMVIEDEEGPTTEYHVLQ